MTSRLNEELYDLARHLISEHSGRLLSELREEREGSAPDSARCSLIREQIAELWLEKGQLSMKDRIQLELTIYKYSRSQDGAASAIDAIKAYTRGD